MVVDEVGQVMKGGECWLDLTINRVSRGIQLWFRTDPRVEAFMKSLAEGEEVTDTIESYGKGWISVNPEKPLMVYRLNHELDSPYYTLTAVGNNLGGTRPPTNISFLRAVGIGSGEGIKFIVTGPINKDYTRAIRENTLVAVRQLVADYIAPIHINMRITSTGI